ncbi:GIY-YIG nuclease family protein [Methylotetracoccus oryzae]|uniref:GIY-YIG nuclease family protein n=1 Tax=Methylotetracoccus oryzae TaxID=1919059 RepID=UPI001F2A64AD|nr:GIY-YIG nuclease family protein [Methylotetracoccus oryzae]
MHRAYQLHIVVPEPLSVRVGALGLCDFPAGRYVYTGSARRNLAARIGRHLTAEKPARWHIDYLLGARGVAIEAVTSFARPECLLNGVTGGHILVPRFGAGDCRFGCGSHLKYVGALAGSR